MSSFCVIVVTEKEKNMDELQQELFKLQDLNTEIFTVNDAGD